MSIKTAQTDHPIHELLSQRWSPYAFADRAVPEADLLSLFEAARWAASSYNEQPWHYIVATKDNPVAFENLLSCLTEGNQGWAKAAPVLVLCVARLKFSDDGTENRAAVHDLGLATGNLLVEATARGLSVHQMIGILPERAREIYDIPEDCAVWTAMAIGYRGEAETLPQRLKTRELRSRQRKSLGEFVFGGKWGLPSSLLPKR